MNVIKSKDRKVSLPFLISLSVGFISVPCLAILVSILVFYLESIIGERYEIWFGWPLLVLMPGFALARALLQGRASVHGPEFLILGYLINGLIFTVVSLAISRFIQRRKSKNGDK